MEPMPISTKGSLEQLHPDGMAVGHDALLDEVMKVVETGAQQGTELVMHERYLSQLPKPQDGRNEDNDADEDVVHPLARHIMGFAQMVFPSLHLYLLLDVIARRNDEAI